ncbi:SH3 domain-containing protein [Pontibacter ummariensis]|uniref:SH3 domain-containing protein n=1 Tax=Pontibacter ummariensis TaxID=1610492 RepID=A0A239BF17_9BACT|nr:SH3 domain-containing C40 family peptidase [Pontibacter ummariensis]PRY16480.1 SH3 domain-containing protein [Pontibacter ummariensis]SNS05918.1 SH3 domain-containing protein [Pontibacter ummariensis]
MKKSPFVFLLGLLIACSPGKDVKTSASATEEALQPHIEAVRQEYAPDKRVVLFQVEPHEQVLAGETNTPAAKEALLARLQEAGLAFVDSIQVLPEVELEGKHKGIITISVANLRSKPGHSSELATQATLGTPVNVWKKEGGWYLVQTPDQYLAWVDDGGVALMDDKDFADWQQGEKLIYTRPYGFAYASADASGATMSDMVYGDVAVRKNKKGDFYEVWFPDGRSGFVLANEAAAYKEWAAGRQPTEDNLVQTSKGLLGLPYLWGGTSFKGVDCSGFTKTVYFMNGLVLPRDASQQVHVGELVDTSNGWDNLRPGDLLFFGRPAKDGKPERVVHVGMWLGNNEFIHSSGHVRISSVNPDAANYDAYNEKRFLRAKRIAPQQTLLDLRTASLYE